MKKILITGGAVHGKLDDVKIITNRFRGGLMADLACALSGDFEIVYLTSKGSVLPHNVTEIIYHDGLYDYQEKVLQLAPDMDAVILGGAVANLIPQAPFDGKFPSHNYKPGDVVNIPFVIAPRIIDQVKKVAPKTCLVGFKLLSGVSKEDLFEAAYGVLQESGASIVIANDAKDLTQKYIVTKEKTMIPCDISETTKFLIKLINSQYYSTKVLPMRSFIAELVQNNVLFKQLLEQYKPKFEKHNNFGTVAVKTDKGFITTSRRKEVESVFITGVNHKELVVYCEGTSKATLNAPLLDSIFNANKDVAYIVHYHEIITGLPLLEYESPATFADSERLEICSSFCVEHHGCYLLFNDKGEQL